MGYKVPESELVKREERTRQRDLELASEDYHRNLSRMDSIDWSTNSAMSEVEWQGYCAACWAFAANSALTTTAAIRTGRKIKLSAQQQVDCTMETGENFQKFGKYYDQDGCGGGYETKTFEFYKDWGAMLDRDYRYTSGETEREGRCKHDPSRVAMKVHEYGEIQGSIKSIHEKL